MYDPCTLAFGFPPYPSGSKLGGRQRSLKGLLYGLKPFIGFDIWHVDPERGGTHNRTDDSCGWFDRGPGEYADAETYVLNDKEALHAIAEALETRDLRTGPYGHVYHRMSSANTLAVCLMVTRYLELRRWWNGQHGNDGAARVHWRKVLTRQRDVNGIAFDLALNPLDNMQSIDQPERLVRLIAAALNRRFRPWWKHPRWHIHHWKIHFDLARNLRRTFQRCAGCGKRLGFGYCPTTYSWDGDGPYFHHECAGGGAASGMEAPSGGETPKSGSTGGDSPTAVGGDAPETPHD